MDGGGASSIARTGNSYPHLLLLLFGLSLSVISLGIYGNTKLSSWFTTNFAAASGHPLQSDNERELGIILSSGQQNAAPDRREEPVITPSKVLTTTGNSQPETSIVKGDPEKQSDAVASKTNNQEPITDESLNQCGNSQRWLKGPRYGNLQGDPLLTDNLVQTLILNLQNLLISDQRHLVLGQTICHADGRFRNDAAAGLALDDRTVHLWAVRLIYYAMHYHQHRLAVPEATKRYSTATGNNDSSCSPQTLLQQHNVSNFDYECPDAKYIILALGGNGLGSHVRGAMVPALLMGLTANRIVLFVNNRRESNNKYLGSRWLLASCPRADHQCVFMPNSPCTLTHDEIANAHKLDGSEYRKLTKKSEPVPEAEHHKVWWFNSQFLPHDFVGPRTVDKLREYAQILVDAVPDTPENTNFKLLLNRALEAIGTVDEKQERQYHFAARWNKIFHSLTMYTMRPNPSSAAELNEMMKEIIPGNFDPETSLGLPVRGRYYFRWAIGFYTTTLVNCNSIWIPDINILVCVFIFLVVTASDKCKYESDCLSFEEHMIVTNDFWGRHAKATGISSSNQQRPTVVFTTEAETMMQEQQAWVEGSKHENSPFEFDFVTNSRDLLPGSGFIKHVGAYF